MGCGSADTAPTHGRQHALSLSALDARVKLTGVFGLILLIGLTPNPAILTLVGFFALVQGIAVLGRLDPVSVALRGLLALPFAGAAAVLVFTTPGPTLAAVPVVGWPISETGLLLFSGIVLKSMVAVQAGALLVMSTAHTETVRALSKMPVPRLLVAIMAFMLRYLDVLREEATRLQRARAARSATPPGAKGPSWRFQVESTGRLVGALLLRSFERGERVYRAMAARGYDGEIRWPEAPRLTAQDWTPVVIVLLLGLLLLLI